MTLSDFIEKGHKFLMTQRQLALDILSEYSLEHFHCLGAQMELFSAVILSDWGALVKNVCKELFSIVIRLTLVGLIIQLYILHV